MNVFSYGIRIFLFFFMTINLSFCGKKYDAQEEFIDGFARVIKNNLYGFIDEEGREVIPLIYTATGNTFYDGLVWVWKNSPDKEEWGYLDKKGDIAIPLKFGCAGDFCDGVAPVCTPETFKRGLIDTTGKVIIPLIYNEIDHLCGEKIVGAEKDGKWGFLNLKNEEVIPFIYDNVKGYGDGLIAVKEGDKWGFIDIEGKQILPFKYDEVIFAFDDGFALIVIDNINYFIDKNGDLYEFVEEPIDENRSGFDRGKKLE